VLQATQGRFDALVTLDRNVPYQHGLDGHALALVVVRVADQTPEAFRGLVPALRKALTGIARGEVRKVGPGS
jgi:hypothetical protein